MRPSSWADRLLALSVRFVGLVILIATLLAAGASFLYNRGEEADRADRVAMQIDMRLRDHIAVLEGVRALYQSDSQSRSEEHTSELQSLMRISYAVFCLKKQNTNTLQTHSRPHSTGRTV